MNADKAKGRRNSFFGVFAAGRPGLASLLQPERSQQYVQRDEAKGASGSRLHSGRIRAQPDSGALRRAHDRLPRRAVLGDARARSASDFRPTIFQSGRFRYARLYHLTGHLGLEFPPSRIRGSRRVDRGNGIRLVGCVRAGRAVLGRRSVVGRPERSLSGSERFDRRPFGQPVHANPSTLSRQSTLRPPLFGRATCQPVRLRDLPGIERAFPASTPAPDARRCGRSAYSIRLVHYVAFVQTAEERSQVV
jgi:hypothetical protein